MKISAYGFLIRWSERWAIIGLAQMLAITGAWSLTACGWRRLIPVG